MSLAQLNLGSAANDGSGDDLRTAGGKINAAFSAIDALQQPSRLSRLKARARPPSRPKAMATPPTVTSGTAVSLARAWPTAHGDAFYNTAPSEFFTWLRCTLSPVQSAASPIFKNILTSLTPTYSQVSVAAVMEVCGDFEIVFQSTTTNPFMVKINDEYVSMTPYVPGSSAYVWKFAFASQDINRVEIIMYNACFVAMMTAATGWVSPAGVRGPRVAMPGDSFTGIAPNGIGQAFGDAMGWDDIFQLGTGGSGLTVAGSGLKFIDRLATDVYPLAPDVVLTLGLTNDWGQPTATVVAAVQAYYAALQANLPNALLVHVPNAQYGWGNMPSQALMLANYKAARAAVIAMGVLWLDLLELPSPTSVAKMSGSVAVTPVAAGATGVRLDFAPPVGSTIELSGASLTAAERVVVTSVAQTTGTTWTSTIDGTTAYAHAIGETAAQVGGSFLVGRGNTAAPTGFGNMDILFDSTHHPNNVIGCRAIGYQIADLFMKALP